MTTFKDKLTAAQDELARMTEIATDNALARNTAETRLQAALVREDMLRKQIERAYDALNTPLDPEKVLDNHWGRALWQSNLATHARAILEGR